MDSHESTILVPAGRPLVQSRSLLWLTLLFPPGQWYLFVPAIHFVIAGRPIPAHLGPGGFAMFDVTHRRIEIGREIVFRRRAMNDHYPYFINFALGCPLGMNIPDLLANEMERALSLGINFDVRPQWNLPHFGLRHRRVKAKQANYKQSNIVTQPSFEMPEYLKRYQLPINGGSSTESVSVNVEVNNSNSLQLPKWIDISAKLPRK